VNTRVIEIHQERGVTGQPQPESYRRTFEDSVVLPAVSLAIDFLVRMNVVTTGHPGEFSYTDPLRGSGTIRCDNWPDKDLERVVDYFVVQELGAELGLRKVPRQWVDRVTYAHLASPTRNPIFMIVFGALGTVAMVGVAAATAWGPLAPAANTGAFVWTTPLLFLAIGALFSVIVVQHARRLRWWMRARALVVSRGQRMPRGLRVFE